MLNQLRYVAYTSDGCTAWECLYCGGRIEVRMSRYDGFICTYCGTLWEAFMVPIGWEWPLRLRAEVEYREHEERKAETHGFVLEDRSTLFEDVLPGWQHRRDLHTTDAHQAYEELARERHRHRDEDDETGRTFLRVVWGKYESPRSW